MIQTWQLQEAKNKLSRVIDDAINNGPQIITRRGVEVAWRLFTRGLSPDVAEEQMVVTGDRALGSRVLRMVSIIA